MEAFLYSLPLVQIHVASVFFTLAMVAIADSRGILWVLGKKQVLSATFLKRLHRLVWIGLVVTAFAGFWLAYPAYEYFLGEFAFRMKLFFVFGLFLNALVIGKHMHVATTRPFAELSRNEKIPLILSGVVSVTCWIGALIAAQFI